MPAIVPSWRIALYAAASLSLAVGGAQLSAELPKRLLAMTPEDFAEAVTVHDDPVAPEVILSTERAHVRWSARHAIVNDNHMRALIDRRTGAIRYELHQSMRYWGDRRDYARVTYEAPDGLRQAPLTLARHGADICPNEELGGQCSRTKQVAFEIKEPVLQSIATGYAPGSGTGWAFTVEERNGAHWNGAVAPAEAAGLIEAVTSYRANRPRAGL